MKAKCQTIDEHCGQPEGSFKQFIEKQEAELKRTEDDRRERIRNGGKKL